MIGVILVPHLRFHLNSVRRLRALLMAEASRQRHLIRHIIIVARTVILPQHCLTYIELLKIAIINLYPLAAIICQFSGLCCRRRMLIRMNGLAILTLLNRLSLQNILLGVVLVQAVEIHLDRFVHFLAYSLEGVG